jgi:zinc transporter ZupT
MNPLYITAIAIFISTFLGGTLALKVKDKLHLILGFSAGSVIGVAFFDLLPESFEMAGNFFDTTTICLVIAIGFIIYMLLDRLVGSHSGGDDFCENHNHKGEIGAGSLSLHSLLDGLVVGLSFQVSVTLGIALAVAIFIHAFSDGINTVNMIVRSGGDIKKAKKWLLTDAIAPVVGIILSLFITMPEKYFGLLVSLFCGFFLYIGASDLLPESHHNHPKIWTTVSTVLGMALIYLATVISGL